MFGSNVMSKQIILIIISSTLKPVSKHFISKTFYCYYLQPATIKMRNTGGNAIMWAVTPIHLILND